MPPCWEHRDGNMVRVRVRAAIGKANTRLCVFAYETEPVETVWEHWLAAQGFYGL